MPKQQAYPQFDLSGAVQSTTSHLMKKQNELVKSFNAVYNRTIGAARRRDGYELVSEISYGKDSLYGGVFEYGPGARMLVAVNNPSDSAAVLSYIDSNLQPTPILSDAAPNTVFDTVSLFNELYVVGANASGDYYPMTNVDAKMTTSRTRNVFQAPAGKFILQFNNRLMVLNCKIGGKLYPSRFYISSSQLAFLTVVQGDQVGNLLQIRVASVKYLKAGMTVDIYKARSNQLKLQGLTIISIDKTNNAITFAGQAINVSDTDEVWISGRKDLPTYLWNTDWPTPQSADFKDLEGQVKGPPDITAATDNNGRALIFTRDSTWKFDGQNLGKVSPTVGCSAPRSVQNIGMWTIWYHAGGIWGYNDNIGEPQLLSKGIDKYIRAISQARPEDISAVVSHNVYKLCVGELLPVDTPTTSTSTSSTSTSSTSSSTSSTSTSSTSVSTSTSTTITTTSTSSTSTSSTSTSSTSVSTSSTSISTSTSTTSTSTSSTSTSSTSTSTVEVVKRITRICYDFDSNVWWFERHRRYQRHQFLFTMHGHEKPYFTDENGYLFRDETGNLDWLDTIPMEIEFGRDNFGISALKSYGSITTESDQAQGTLLYASIDGGRFKQVGQIDKRTQDFELIKMSGHDINLKYVSNTKGEPPIINGQITYYSVDEAIHV
jgi:hypothetical protein